jgi:hypothetical protein
MSSPAVRNGNHLLLCPVNESRKDNQNDTHEILYDRKKVSIDYSMKGERRVTCGFDLEARRWTLLARSGISQARAAASGSAQAMRGVSCRSWSGLDSCRFVLRSTLLVEISEIPNPRQLHLAGEDIGKPQSPPVATMIGPLVLGRSMLVMIQQGRVREPPPRLAGWHPMIRWCRGGGKSDAMCFLFFYLVSVCRWVD